MTFDRTTTIIIPTIPGRGELRTRALRSAMFQTEWVARVQEDIPQWWVQYDEQREGAAKTRNRAIERTEAHWLAFLDDDDLLSPEHLEVCLDAAEKTGADLVYPYPDFGDHRDPLATLHNGRIVKPFGVPFGPEQEWWLRNMGNFIPVTHLVRRELVQQVGGFPEQGGFQVAAGNNSGDCEDFGLLLRLLDAGAKFHHVPQVTWVYRQHDSNTGGRPA